MPKTAILNAITGVTGVTTIEAINQVPGNDSVEIIKLILQIIVAVGSIISMFRRKSKAEKENVI